MSSHELTEVGLFHRTVEQMSWHDLHRDRAISLYSKGNVLTRVSSKQNYFTLQTNKFSQTRCSVIEQFHGTDEEMSSHKLHRDRAISLYWNATRHVITRVAPLEKSFTVQTNKCSNTSCTEIGIFTVQTSNTPCPHTTCTEVEQFHSTEEQHAMSLQDLHRDRPILSYWRRNALTRVAPW
jgi:hypothetical protein